MNTYENGITVLPKTALVLSALLHALDLGPVTFHHEKLRWRSRLVHSLGPTEDGKPTLQVLDSFSKTGTDVGQIWDTSRTK